MDYSDFTYTINRDKLKHRNRNYVSAMRKKIELFENIKKNKEALTPEKYKECALSLAELQNEIAAMQKELDIYKVQDGLGNPLVDKLKKGVEYLSSKYNDVKTYKEDNIYYVEYITNPILMKFNGESVNVGRIRVQIFYNVSGGNVKFTNLDRRVDEFYDHPHIYNHNACWGSFNYIVKFLNEVNLEEFSTHLDLFLTSYNPDSPYRKLHYWKVGTEYCKKCGDLLRDCKCPGRLHIDYDDEYEDDYVEDEYGYDNEDEYEEEYNEEDDYI